MALEVIIMIYFVISQRIINACQELNKYKPNNNQNRNMKKSMVLCAGICAVLAFASCSGSKESAYKKAYLKAQAKQEQPAEQPVQEEAPVVLRSWRNLPTRQLLSTIRTM